MSDDKEILAEFIEIASEAAGMDYDLMFIDPVFGEDELGVYAHTYLISEEENEYPPKPEEMSKLRVVRNLSIPGHQYERVVIVYWINADGIERVPAICGCPKDLMAVFYA